MTNAEFIELARSVSFGGSGLAGDKDSAVYCFGISELGELYQAAHAEFMASLAEDWISVSENTPKCDMEVLILKGNTKIVANFFMGNWWLYDLETDNYSYEIPSGHLPTHWMPLPNLPTKASKIIKE